MWVDKRTREHCCMLCVFIFWVPAVDFFMCVWRLRVSGKKDRWLKVGSGATPALHRMNIWLKRCLSTLSKALVLQSLQTQYKRWWWGGKTVNAAPWLPPSPLPLSIFLFAPLHTHHFPSLHPSHWSVFVLSEKHLSCPLWLLPVPFVSPFAAFMEKKKWFAGFHRYYCHH